MTGRRLGLWTSSMAIGDIKRGSFSAICGDLQRFYEGLVGGSNLGEALFADTVPISTYPRLAGSGKCTYIRCHMNFLRPPTCCLLRRELRVLSV